VTTNFALPAGAPNEFVSTGTGGLLATAQGFDCTVAFQSTTPDLDALKRFLASLAVLYMPPEGLDETLSDLRDNWDFYTHQQQLSPEPPLVKSGQGHIVSLLRSSPVSITE
jgi:hypothetical protein